MSEHKAGDRVEIRKDSVESYKARYDGKDGRPAWSSDKAQYIGERGKVSEVFHSGNISVYFKDGECWLFLPSDVLPRVSKRQRIAELLAENEKLQQERDSFGEKCEAMQQALYSEREAWRVKRAAYIAQIANTRTKQVRNLSRAYDDARAANQPTANQICRKGLGKWTQQRQSQQSAAAKATPADPPAAEPAVETILSHDPASGVTVTAQHDKATGVLTVTDMTEPAQPAPEPPRASASHRRTFRWH